MKYDHPNTVLFKIIAIFLFTLFAVLFGVGNYYIGKDEDNKDSTEFKGGISSLVLSFVVLFILIGLYASEDYHDMPRKIYVPY